VDNTRDYARVSHSRQCSNYNNYLKSCPWDYRKIDSKSVVSSPTQYALSQTDRQTDRQTTLS